MLSPWASEEAHGLARQSDGGAAPFVPSEFKPHYDINVHSNDGWGVRDSAATKRLGGATFRAEMSKARVPGKSRVLPKETPKRLMD